VGDALEDRVPVRLRGVVAPVLLVTLPAGETEHAIGPDGDWPPVQGSDGPDPCHDRHHPTLAAHDVVQDIAADASTTASTALESHMSHMGRAMGDLSFETPVTSIKMLLLSHIYPMVFVCADDVRGTTVFHALFMLFTGGSHVELVPWEV